MGLVNNVNSINDSNEMTPNTIPKDNPGCTNPPNYKNTTAFIDSAASLTLLQQQAVCKLALVQEKNKTLGTPNGSNMQTSKTIELLLPKLPPPARKGFTVPGIKLSLSC